jgi:hypothetical protein
MNKVFLGGTCNESNWRNLLIPMLEIDYFNPVVDDWTPDCMAEEIRQRESCDYVLYTISKEMTGVYSIAEVVDDSNKRPEKTILCILKDGFNEGQLRSLKSVAQMVQNNGGMFFDNLKEVSIYLNNHYTENEDDGKYLEKD